jgi:RNA polymerase sigma factor (sigma-70 family)
MHASRAVAGPPIAVLESPDAFTEWIRPHLPMMARVAARLGPDGQRDDIVQDAMLRAWQQRSKFDPRRGAPASWLAAITADRARKSRRAKVVDLYPSEREPVDHPADLDLADAVRRLSGRQRLAVELHYFVGLTVAETASAMGCSDGTVKSTLADARDRLRRNLEKP